MRSCIQTKTPCSRRPKRLTSSANRDRGEGDSRSIEHPSTLIQTARDDLAGLRAFILNHHIATIPNDLLPKVEETPGFQRAMTAAAMDPPGPLEWRATQAFYYVTPPEAGLAADKLEQYLEAYYFAGLEIISTHEVWPGHFMQYLTARAHPDWSLTRRMAESYFTTEGWAHYAEQMMVEQGLGDGNPNLKVVPRKLKIVPVASASRIAGTMPMVSALITTCCRA